jgi:signal transduction histidine kinase
MREAVYTRLGPGAYRFDVVASNDDGVWSPHSASVDFEILPAFYQTSWFLAACLILGVALLYSLVRLRMWQITKRIREGLEERAAERERISREIHDTLLQSVQGLTLTVHSALDRIPATHSEGRAPLESVLDRADRTITEARQRIAGLRTQGPGAGLAQTIEETVRTSALQHIQPRLTIHRGERRIHALVLAELSSILREALNNIAWHANAKVVEIVVSVRDNGLELVVADDGVGIPAEILAKGFKEGHFGLIGMRERAERCGGELLFARGKNGCGTRITFSIPGHAAFEEVTKPSLRKELLRVLKVVTPGRRRHGGR